jgi:uncharacterized protein (DUF697 family)
MEAKQQKTMQEEAEDKHAENQKAEEQKSESRRAEEEPYENPIRQDAERIIKMHTAWSVGAGFVPLPWLDILAVAVVQLDMLKQLCRIYNKNYSESSGKAMLSTVTGSSLARFGASFIKAIPGLGTVLGGISMPVLAGASTYAIGQAVVRHLESGGNFLDFDLGEIKKWYAEHLKKGKDVAMHMYKKQKKSSKAAMAVKELEELVKMRDEGVITEEEFQLKKKNLLEVL